MTIHGQVVFEDIEGGVWGIRDASGTAYMPVGGLPGRFRKIGQRVKAEVEPANVFTTTMWGRAVTLHSIETD